MACQKFCLKWDNFKDSVTALFDSLRRNDELVDITLCCEGAQVPAHRLMLSACSPYFRDVFKNLSGQQLVFFMKDTSAADLHALVEFIYKGSVNVAQDQLPSFIKTAELLQISGLSGEEEKKSEPVPAAQHQSAQPAARSVPDHASVYTPVAKRRRTSGAGSLPEGNSYSVSDVNTSATDDFTSDRGINQQYSSSNAGMFLDSKRFQQDTSSPHAMENSRSSSGQTPASDAFHQATVNSLPVKVEQDASAQNNDDGSFQTVQEITANEEMRGIYDENYSNLKGRAASNVLNSGASSGAAASLGQEGSSQSTGTEDPNARGAYVCDQCGRQFRSPESLQMHWKVHAGLTVCPLCGRINNRVADLRKHLRSRHGLDEQAVRSLVPTRHRWHARLQV